MKFSVCVPLHNEENYIPIFINNIIKLNPDEIIFGLDRCNDNSEKLIKHYMKKHDYIDYRIIKFDDEINYKHRLAGIRRSLFIECRNNIIFNIDIDVIPDIKILNIFDYVDKYKLISIGYFDYPFNIRSFIRYIIAESKIIHGFSGYYIFHKDIWLECENQEELKKIDFMKSEDTFLFLSITKKYKTTHINTKTLHLRCNESIKDNFDRGVSQNRLLQKSLLMNILHGFIMLRPMTIKGYLMDRGLIK